MKRRFSDGQIIKIKCMGPEFSNKIPINHLELRSQWYVTAKQSEVDMPFWDGQIYNDKVYMYRTVSQILQPNPYKPPWAQEPTIHYSKKNLKVGKWK